MTELANNARWAMFPGEALATLASMPTASVDAVITDPPYSSGGMTRGDRTAVPSLKYVQTGTQIARPDFAGDNRDQRSFEYWCVLWLAECLRIAKPGAPICLFTDWRQLPSTTDALQAGGWVWRGIVPWDKTEACRPVLGRFMSQCEYIAWGSAGPMALERSVGDGDVRVLPGVIRERVRLADKHHITGKPTEVMRHLVRICEPGGIVLDPFAGSGSTGVAALIEGRRFIGCEVVPEYCDVARDRLTATERESTLEDLRAGQEALFR